MIYRTRTYIAGDWDGDRDAIEQLHKWNESNYWGLHFSDVHAFHQSRDSSLNCSIKRSLKERMDESKRFVLIVGLKTRDLRSGACYLCNDYDLRQGCLRGRCVDNLSYVDYECEKAWEAKIDIVVLYNACTVDRSKCPERLRYVGRHVAMCYRSGGVTYWDYQAVKEALS